MVFDSLPGWAWAIITLIVVIPGTMILAFLLNLKDRILNKNKTDGEQQ